MVDRVVAAFEYWVVTRSVGAGDQLMAALWELEHLRDRHAADR